MNAAGRKGTSLMVAIIAIAMVASAVIILSAASASLADQTALAYLDACNRSLQASGLLWADLHRRETGKKEGKNLNVDKLNCPAAQLTVFLQTGKGQPPAARIVSVSSQGALTVRQNRLYSLEGPVGNTPSPKAASSR